MGANCGTSCDNCGRRQIVDTNAQPDIDTKRGYDKRRGASQMISKDTNTNTNTFKSSYESMDTKLMQTKLNNVPSSASSSSSDEYSQYDPSSTSKYLDTLEQPPPESSVEPIAPSNEESKQKAISGFKTAILRGKETLALYYIEEHPDLDLLSTPFENDDNCLQIAIKNRSYKLVYYLLNQGISPDAQNPNSGDTSLHTAVRERDMKMVTLLSKYCADPSIKNMNLETPITIATENNDDHIIELLEPETQDFIHAQLCTIREYPGDDENDLPNPPSLEPSDNEGIVTPTFDFNDNPSAGETGNKSKAKLKQRYTKSRSRPSVSPATPKQTASKQSKRKFKAFQSGTKTDLVKIDTKTMANVKHGSSSLQSPKVFSPIARKPFGRLRRDRTGSMLDAFAKIADEHRELPPLESWLEKKSRSMKGWQKRWVMVRKNYILWSDVKRGIKDCDVKNVKERMRFNNSINLICVKSVKAVTESKSQRKFILSIEIDGLNGTKKRKEYLWKAATRTDRDYWVKGIKEHVSQMKSMIAYLDH